MTLFLLNQLGLLHAEHLNFDFIVLPEDSEEQTIRRFYYIVIQSRSVDKHNRLLYGCFLLIKILLKTLLRLIKIRMEDTKVKTMIKKSALNTVTIDCDVKTSVLHRRRLLQQTKILTPLTTIYVHRS